MNNKAIRLVIILGIISIAGILATQVYFIIKDFNQREKLFNQTVSVALKNVAERILKYNQSPQDLVNPVTQVSSNYFAVMVNDKIDANLLEVLLRNEFEKRNIKIDFEYGIYDCDSQKMVYGNYITSTNVLHDVKASKLPLWNKDNYYFGVNFPGKNSLIYNQMGIWFFFSAVLLIVVIFFGYAIFVILDQKRLSEVQKDFINNMTHEFKTPISTISISSEVLQNPNIIHQPERLLNYATIIQKESSRMLGQVERVLRMAHIQKKEILLNKENVDIHLVIDEIVKKFELNSLGQEISIQKDLKASASVIKADKLHITNVFHNLVDNAIKYSPEEINILISTCNSKKTVEVDIKDYGKGIPKELQKKIFDNFYRVPTGNVHDVKGFGIGLYYVKNIMDLHKGAISVKNNEKSGSTFTLSFPQ